MEILSDPINKEWKPPAHGNTTNGLQVGGSDKRTSIKRHQSNDWVNKWEKHSWCERYIEMRGNESYRPYLLRLQDTDTQRRVERLSVYQPAISETERSTYAQVWNGPYAATIKDEKVKGWQKRQRFPLFSRERVASGLPLDIENDIPIGEGELVRKVLNEFPQPFPVCRNRQVLAPPRYFWPEKPKDHLNVKMELVDISRCYSQLMAALPTTLIGFDHGARLFLPIPEYPAINGSFYASKHFGRALVGTLEPSHGRCFHYGVRHTFRSRLYHPNTVAWVRRVLHAIALIAKEEYGCIRWHTDGGLFRYGLGDSFVRFLDSINLKSTIITGRGNVFSLDDYKIGTKQTQHYISANRGKLSYLPIADGGRQIDNLAYDTSIDWVLSTLTNQTVNTQLFINGEIETKGMDLLNRVFGH